MYTYTHKVRYYETDRMGITHHSNYIRFMEEARVEWMKNTGWGYKKCEELGIMSPVLRVDCSYKRNTTFDDDIVIKVKLAKYNGIKMTIEYEMTKDEEIVAIAESEHCFVNQNGFPIRIKKEYPEFDEVLRKEIEE